MERYTLQQRIDIVKIHYRNGAHFAETVRKVRTAFGRPGPSRTGIVKLIKKFELLGLTDVKNQNRARRARTTGNMATVALSVAENPGLSIPRRSQKLGISQTTLHRILHQDLGHNQKELSNMNASMNYDANRVEKIREVKAGYPLVIEKQAAVVVPDEKKSKITEASSSTNRPDKGRRKKNDTKRTQE